MSYFILSFTGAEPDTRKRAYLGRCLIFISMSNIIVLLSQVLIDSIRNAIDIIKKVKKRFSRKFRR